MRRFFTTPESLLESPATISGDLFRHISTVLRLEAGDSFILADGCDNDVVATIREIGKGCLLADLGSPYSSSSTDSALQISLCQALPKGEKMDLILQKSTELGVSHIFGFNGERSVARLDGEKSGKRMVRWEKIVLEAARQSGRGTIPAVGFHGTLNALLKSDVSELKLFLWEDEKQQSLRAVIEDRKKPASISIIVGPEGGLSSKEADQAVEAGYIPVTLGSRILRTETAGLAAISILQYVWGDLG